MAERQQAIQSGSFVAEWRANQSICRGLQDAANTCPRSAPQAKQGFQNMANLYRDKPSRRERDNLVLHFAKRVLSMKNLASVLAGAAALTFDALASPGTLYSFGDTWEGSKDVVDDETGSTSSSELFELFEDPF
ncbi:hypothetical protein RhiJN_16195 [Ceratobasidium sp. AG-Ba]|nr:hypothetical protein RhiJN_16195 [Ceratobasidium sp. AG-Ba]